MGNRAFYGNDTIMAIFLGVNTKLMDQYGNEVIERVIKLKMTETEFFIFEWENLEYRPIYQQMKRSCEIHWIHPAIRKKIDPNELYLTLD